MYLVFLEFTEQRAEAPRLMQSHNDWLQRGFDEGVFLLAGRLEPKQGGGIVAHNTSRPELERRLAEDPFVAHNVVAARIVELSPSKADPRLGFMLG